MPDQQTITTYYDALAPSYDQDRFGNSYGQYLHRQETQLLKSYLKAPSSTLDLGCGTGRFLSFADQGVDVSESMIEQARQKFPEKEFQVADARTLPYPDQAFKNVFSMHVFMHLQADVVQQILQEAYRILRPGGLFLFDVPSRRRRELIRYQAPSDWHGAFSLGQKEVRQMLGQQWELQAWHGIAMLPIHRLPKGLRPAMVALDAGLCRTPLKAYSSYLLFVLRKR